jgi:hypothetical protein
VLPLAFDKVWSAVICVLVTALLRRVSLHYNIYSPAEVDLGPGLKRAALDVAQAAKEATDNEADHALQQHRRQKERRRGGAGRRA